MLCNGRAASTPAQTSCHLAAVLSSFPVACPVLLVWLLVRNGARRALAMPWPPMTATATADAA
jgi:hypothetical protein